MAQFEHPSNGILIHVVCKAWARNIRHHLNDMIGLAQFQLLVD
jgi:sodium/potassium-transporting ATPase subunit beta